ncbi:hypothetical protein GCM10022377_10260 [Zhihengliuella alba]|uniref:Minor tail protein n=1 Tax=Zhihengliuella alba TaxID=547018 RepID=A0ABP7D455_9MICC
MAMYLGTPGRMIEIKGASSLRITPAPRFTPEESVEGRVSGQVRPIGRRVWDASLPEATTPSEVAVLAGFLDGDWDVGPFAFLSSEALVVNTLTPETSACRPGTYVKGPGLTQVTEGGPLTLPGGRTTPRSWNKTNDGSLFYGANPTVVVPGTVVTASAYVRGAGAAAGIIFYNGLGATITSTISAVTASASTVARSFVTATVPAGAVSARVHANAAASTTADPVITWTSSLLEYGKGQGCEQAIPYGDSRDLVMAASGTAGGRFSRPSFTIQEVG